MAWQHWLQIWIIQQYGETNVQTNSLTDVGVVLLLNALN
jgi:hypothetical protein